MSSEKMEELSIKELISSYNFIIPEIQREYVWGNKDIVNSFIDDILTGYKNISNTDKSGDLSYKNLQGLTEQYEKIISNHGMNIGFLYSYRPSYSFNDKAEEDVYLIDGQQRFTTIFLLLLYLALKTDNQKDFKEIFRYNPSKKKIAFDYRVRDTTHDFIVTMINKCNTTEAILGMEGKTWFLAEYKNDPTIQAMIAAIKKIDEKLKESDCSKLFNFVFENIKFWHFKTEATSQGEELYITMNSRGESLKDYENIKAVLFEKENGDKQKWGQKWELWQDFFWKNKPTNDKNADKGFNCFLDWVKEIEQIRQVIKEPDLNLTIIENYFVALKFLIEKCMTSENKPMYCEFAKYKDFIAKDINNKNKVALFPVLIYLKSICTPNIYDKDYVFNRKADIDDIRIIRFFSNVSKFSEEFKEAVKLSFSVFDCAQSATVANLLKEKDNYKNILTEEEVFKLSIYKDAGDQREKYEEAFWKAEDHQIVSGKLANLFKISQNIDNINNLEHGKFDLAKFENSFSVLEKNVSANEFIYAMLTTTKDINCFGVGWSWGYRRYHINNQLNTYYSAGLLNIVLGELQNGLSCRDIIDKYLAEEEDLLLKKVKSKVCEHKRKIFFYNENEIFFPNGVQAKSNTERISLS